MTGDRGDYHSYITDIGDGCGRGRDGTHTATSNTTRTKQVINTVTLHSRNHWAKAVKGRGRKRGS